MSARENSVWFLENSYIFEVIKQHPLKNDSSFAEGNSGRGVLHVLVLVQHVESLGEESFSELYRTMF